MSSAERPDLATQDRDATMQEHRSLLGVGGSTDDAAHVPEAMAGQLACTVFVGVYEAELTADGVAEASCVENAL